MRQRGYAVQIIIALAFALTSCSTPQQQTIQPSIDVARSNSVAVWELDDLSPTDASQSDLAQLLTGAVTEVMGSGGKYALVERQQLLLALEELNLGSTELVDESTRLRLGKIVGAGMMVFGSYQTIGDIMRLDLRLVDVRTGKVLKAVERIVPSRDLGAWLEATREAARELL